MQPGYWRAKRFYDKMSMYSTCKTVDWTVHYNAKNNAKKNTECSQIEDKSYEA